MNNIEKDYKINFNKGLEKMKKAELSNDIGVSINEGNGELIASNLNKMIANGKVIKGALMEGIDKDYALIPHCGNKPSLLQPGADKILTLYGLSISYSIVEKEQTDLGWTLLIEATLRSAATGMFVSNAFAGFDPNGSNSDKQNGKKLDTALKVCQKRAKVWAVKSIGGLSDIFADDLTDWTNEAHFITESKQKEIFKIIFNILGDRSKVKTDLNLVVSKWNDNKENTAISSISRLDKDNYEGFVKHIYNFYGVKNE